MKVYTFTEKELDEALMELHKVIPVSLSLSHVEIVIVKDALIVAAIKNNQVTEQ